MSETNLLRQIEEVKAAIVSINLSLSIIAAANCSGPFASYLALEASVLRKLLEAVRPDCRQDLQLVLAGSALDYYDGLRDAAAIKCMGLQTGLA